MSRNRKATVYTEVMVTTRTNTKKSCNKGIVIISTAVCCSLLTLWSLRELQAATTTATVQANIVSTINLAALNGIEFGDISSSSTPGTVVISTDGTRTTTGGVTINSGSPGTPAKYEASGDPNALYSITLPASVILTSAGGDNMTVDNFISVPGTNGQLDAGGKENLNVGATMNVGSFQPFGAYSGIMSTTIEYN